MLSSWFYNNEEEKEVEDFDVEIEEEVEEEVEDDFLKCLMYEDDNVKYYSSDVRDFIPNIKLWSSQRSINFKHVEELIKCLKIKNHFIGTFKVIRDKENNIRLIDGQHRFEAIKKIMENDSSFNMNIIIELYETDSMDSDYTINLFKEANSCMPYSYWKEKARRTCSEYSTKCGSNSTTGSGGGSKVGKTTE